MNRSHGMVRSGCGKDLLKFVHRFVRDEEGQDLVEYSLLLAFVCLASAALFLGVGDNLAGTWAQANSRLSAANSAANS